MDAHEFYLYFGASYVLICQLELKLWNHNYKNLFKLARFLLCIYNQKYTMFSNFIFGATPLILVLEQKCKVFWNPER